VNMEHDPNSIWEWKLHLRRVNGQIKANRKKGIVFIYVFDTFLLFNNSIGCAEMAWLRGLREKILQKIDKLKHMRKGC